MEPVGVKPAGFLYVRKVLVFLIFRLYTEFILWKLYMVWCYEGGKHGKAILLLWGNE